VRFVARARNRPNFLAPTGFAVCKGILAHLNNHDVSYAAVARAPIEEIEVVRKRMDWKFPWVSSYRSDFNYDFDVSFTPEQVASGRAI
jgi:predicted dithiol-disulfide oxidoreductase (DUF899 family)